MMSFIQQFYQDCLVKFALMGPCPGPRGAGNGKSGFSPEYLYYSVDIRTESKKNFQSVMDDLCEKLKIHELDTLFSTNHFV